MIIKLFLMRNNVYAQGINMRRCMERTQEAVSAYWVCVMSKRLNASREGRTVVTMTCSSQAGATAKATRFTIDSSVGSFISYRGLSLLSAPPPCTIPLEANQFSSCSNFHLERLALYSCTVSRGDRCNFSTFLWEGEYVFRGDNLMCWDRVTPKSTANKDSFPCALPSIVFYAAAIAVSHIILH